MATQNALLAMETAKQVRIDRYLENPTLCASCEKPLPYEKRKYKFCGHSCSAHIGNQVRPSTRKYNGKFCLYCGDEITKRGDVSYCSIKCHVEKRKDDTTREIAAGNVSSPATLRRYMLELRGHKCDNCNNHEWLGQAIPLELDHIDGDSNNNIPSNLRLLCPNCHALTETYKAKNVGKGRAYRRQRYADGKSY